MSNSLSFYQTNFQRATAEQQTSFLEQLFEKDSELRNQFEQFIANWNEVSKNDAPLLSFIDLDELAEEVREVLSDMNFDMESVYDHFKQGDRSYVPQYEAAYEGAINMLREEGFESYTEQAEQFLKKGNLLDGTKVLLAMYEGHNNVYEPGFDEENAIEDYNYNCLDIFKEQLQILLSYYKRHTQETTAVCQVLDLLIERLILWREHYDESLSEDEFMDGNVVYNLSVFEPLLLAIIDNAVTAVHLKNLLLEHDLKNKNTSKIFLRIATLDTNQEDWVTTAEKFAKDDQSIMRQLLKHYQQKGKEKDVYRIAKKAFQHFSSAMYKEILPLIEPEKDEAFYVKVLAHATKSSRDIEQYRSLKQYLNQEEKANFIGQQKQWMDFYVAMLAEEQRYTEILTILENHPASADGWSSTEGRFATIATQISDQYPSEVFQILQQAVDKALKRGRGRGVYIAVTNWMAVMLKIKGYETNARNYIDGIARKFNNFRALKDEMRQGGVL